MSCFLASLRVVLKQAKGGPMAAEDSGKAEKQRIDSKPMVENKAGAEAPKKKSSKLLLLIVMAVSLLGLGAGGAYVYFKILKKPSSGEKEKPKEVVITEQVKDTLALEPFLVNLADPEEVHFVKTTFQLGLGEKLEGESKHPVEVAAIRDSIISLLSSKTAEQILSTQGKEELRKEIRTRVNRLSNLKVIEVFIVDFVVQL
jgi:flagellar protein FliL